MIQVIVRTIFAAVFFVSINACALPDPGGEGAPGAEHPPADPGIGELGGMCDGIAGFQCKDEGNYCRHEPGKCLEVADDAGVCTTKPEVCTMDYRPVCGCDGKTYSNACMAAGAGTSVASQGACESS